MDCGTLFLTINKYYMLLLLFVLSVVIFFGVNDSQLLVQVDYTAVFLFRLLMFVDNGLAAGMGL